MAPVIWVRKVLLVHPLEAVGEARRRAGPGPGSGPRCAARWPRCRRWRRPLGPDAGSRAQSRARPGSGSPRVPEASGRCSGPTQRAQLGEVVAQRLVGDLGTARARATCRSGSGRPAGAGGRGGPDRPRAPRRTVGSLRWSEIEDFQRAEDVDPGLPSSRRIFGGDRFCDRILEDGGGWLSANRVVDRLEIDADRRCVDAACSAVRRRRLCRITMPPARIARARTASQIGSPPEPPVGPEPAEVAASVGGRGSPSHGGVG